MVKLWPLLLCVFALAGCVSPPLRSVPPLHLHDAEIATDTLWQGQIVIDGQVKVFKGATLTIAPGTEIAFIQRDDDRDGLGDGTLIIEGSLQAIGTPAQPISFRSAAANPQPGDWLEIRVDFSKETHLRYCDIRDSAHGLHAHFTKATVEESHIHHNIDGCRLGQGNFIFRRNLIEENEGKGLNFRNSTIEISDNIIRYNNAGVFLFETDRPPTIEHNNFYANNDNLRLGDFFHRDITTGQNWWGSSNPATVAASIYDSRVDATLGTVTVGIASEWLQGCGPQDPLQLLPLFIVATDGFVDSTPQVMDGDLLVASWDGTVRRLDPKGNFLWKISTKEVIDAPLLVDGKKIFGQNWGREIFALDAANGQRLWSWNYPSSPSDDHRQGGLLRVADLLLVPAWNGTLYALDPQSGKELWSFSGRGPLRAQPVIVNGMILLAAGDGTLSALALDGALLWQFHSPAPFLTPALSLKEEIVILSRDGGITALDHDGKVLWQQELGETCYYSAPVQGDDGIFIATAAGNLWKLTLNGEIVWRTTGFGPVYSTPLLRGNRLVVGDNNGILWVVDSISGNVLVKSQIGGPIQGGPINFDGGIALGSRDQKLHVLQLVNGESSPR